MSTKWYFALVLALIWGIVWARCLQTKRGRFLAARYTWITVIIGVGLDMAIGLLVIDPAAILSMLFIMGASSLGIITRSILNDQRDYAELREILHEHQDTRSK